MQPKKNSDRGSAEKYGSPPFGITERQWTLNGQRETSETEFWQAFNESNEILALNDSSERELRIVGSGRSESAWLGLFARAAFERAPSTKLAPVFAHTDMFLELDKQEASYAVASRIIESLLKDKLATEQV